MWNRGWPRSWLWNWPWELTTGRTRAPKNVEKNSLFFIFVDEFQKIIRCFLFPLIFSTNSTNQRNQRNEFNESTNKIFVDLTKFQRIFNEKFNESTKISTNQRKFWKKSSNSLKCFSKSVDALKIAVDPLKVWSIHWNFHWKFVNIFTNQRKFYPLIRWIRWRFFKSIFFRWFRFSNQRIQRNQYFFFNENESTNKYFQRKKYFFGALSTIMNGQFHVDPENLSP